MGEKRKTRTVVVLGMLLTMALQLTSVLWWKKEVDTALRNFEHRAELRYLLLSYDLRLFEYREMDRGLYRVEQDLTEALSTVDAGLCRMILRDLLLSYDLRLQHLAWSVDHRHDLSEEEFSRVVRETQASFKDYLAEVREITPAQGLEDVHGSTLELATEAVSLANVAERCAKWPTVCEEKLQALDEDLQETQVRLEELQLYAE